MIRYYWTGEGKYLYKTDLMSKEDRFEVLYSRERIFVNILEVKEYATRIKLFYSNGEVVEGWIITRHFRNDYIRIQDEDDLFDGRFNQ